MSSPVAIQASKLGSMQVWVDSAKKYSEISSNSLDTLLARRAKKARSQRWAPGTCA